MKPSTTIPLFLSAAAHSPYAATAYTTSSKASKSGQGDCPPTPDVVECGDEFDSGVITLGGNLVCESIENPDASSNAAITVRGEGTVFDCQGYTVSQETDSSAAAMDCTQSAANATQLKEECGISYVYGIKAYDGATVRNCNIQKFWAGVSSDYIVDTLPGATFDNIEASLNYYGLLITAEDSDITQYKVLNSNFYNNGNDGILAGTDNTIIDNVVSKNNRNGIVTAGSDITIRNAKAVNNADAGIVLINPYDSYLDGHVYANNNGVGVEISAGDNTQRTVNVVGDLIAERNVDNGISIEGFFTEDIDVTMVLGSSPSSSGKSGKAGSSGSVKACMNGNVDIDSSFGNFEGDDYTCDGDLSKCNECYPGCFA